MRWPVLAVVAATLLVVGMAELHERPAGAAVAATASLFDDDGGAAIFNDAAPMRSGETRVGCIELGAVDAAAGHEVAFAAGNVTGDLATRLTVVVEIGAGGRLGDCSQFVGDRVWSGTLAELAAPSPPTGIWTGWEPAASPQRSFRISTTLSGDPTAAGATATADLLWQLIDPSPTPTTAVPATVTATTVLAVPPGSDPIAPSSTFVAASTTLTTRRTDATSAPTGGSTVTTMNDRDPAAGTTATEPGAGVPDVLLRADPPAGLARVLAMTLEVAKSTARTARFPLAGFIVAGCFIALQHHLDARDPKLMLAARSQRDIERDIPDRFGSGGGGRRR